MEREFHTLTKQERQQVYQEFLNQGNYDTFEGFSKMNRNTLLDEDLNITEISWR